MKDIAIYGAGGFGREVACLINVINQSKPEPEWNLVGFFDDNPDLKDKMISHFGLCLGGINELNAYTREINLTLPIGNPKVVKSLVEKIQNPHISFPNLIRPGFQVSDPVSFSIGKGNIIQSSCSASCDVSIGDFNVFNGAVVLGHDVTIGSYNTFMPAVRVSGEVEIGMCNFFGVSSIVLQQIKVGAYVRLGAGSVLMTKPKDGCLYIGNPAKKTEL